MSSGISPHRSQQRTDFLSWSRLSLPTFITQKNKVLAGVILSVISVALYLLSNHYPIFKPRMLPMTWIDERVPFVPQTIFIYLSEYFLFGFVYFFAKDMKNLNKYIYSFLFLQTFSVIVFLLFPTTYPRDRFPLTPDLDAWTVYFFSGLRSADSPNSCMPSLHVSSCYLSAFVYLDEQREKFPIFFLWATAVGVSTLTTKQHYIADVFAGLVTAIFFYWFVHHWSTYRPLKELLKR